MNEADKPIFDRRESKLTATTFAGLEFDTDLVSSQGIHVTLFITDKTTKEQIKKAKSAAKAARDVVSFSTERVPEEWLEADRFVPGEKKTWVEAIQYICEGGGARRINLDTNELVPEGKSGGTLVDHYTASAVWAVYKAINDDNKHKYSQRPLIQAIDIAWKLIKQSREKKS